MNEKNSDNTEKKLSRLEVMRKLFYFGLGVKRWILTGVIGISISSIGFAFVIKNIFTLGLPDVIPWHLEGVLLGIAGLGIILISLYKLYQSTAPLLLSSSRLDVLTETIYKRRSLSRGPKIVAIGGGTGLSTLLSGMKSYSDNLTAMITVADDGGSSGRLRRELGILPPGDFRNCLVAMSDSETLLRDLFQYRFAQGNGLEGHSFGNLFIAAMAEVTGSFEKALLESSQVLAVHGRTLPVTLSQISLSAQLLDGTVIDGETTITEQGGSIDRILISPQDATAYPVALEAISNADILVIGPGSLYTSIIPNLLVNGVAKTIRESKATKIYVCNVATQMGETDGYSASDHLKALQKHTFRSIVEYAIVSEDSNNLEYHLQTNQVKSDSEDIVNVKVIKEDLIDTKLPARHNALKLAQVIMDVYDGKYLSNKPIT